MFVNDVIVRIMLPYLFFNQGRKFFFFFFEKQPRKEIETSIYVNKYYLIFIPVNQIIIII